MKDAEWCSPATEAVRTLIELEHPDRAQLTELTLLVLEEIWQSFKAVEPAVRDLTSEDDTTVDGPVRARTGFKDVLAAAHRLRVANGTPPALAP